MLLKICLESIGDAYGYDLAKDIEDILANYVNKKPLALVSEVYGSIIGWYLCEIVATASSACFFEPIVLKHDKPGESAKIGANYVWSHHVEHLFLSLKVIHEARKQEKDHPSH